MSIVAFLEGILVETRECNNKDYFQAIFNFPEEVYGKVFALEEMPRPKKTNILCESKRDNYIKNLDWGKKYKLQVSIGVRQPNERDGKKYPAAINLNILKVVANG